ncbi:hypothetical protein [Bacillus solitudinis]|uniref:hypothetical protein n=1 Tax=Bacillus solitudinis TaxID=2014074 RepID=UPI000C238229|nr:hypothetical protein [Bacillus solitudinis]
MRKTDREYKVTEMNFAELDRILYKKAKEANDHLFGGVLPFISRLMDENEIILKELDYLKAYIQSTEKPIIKPVKEEVVSVERSTKVTEKPQNVKVEQPVYEEPTKEEVERANRYFNKTPREQKRLSKVKLKGEIE